MMRGDESDNDDASIEGALARNFFRTDSDSSSEGCCFDNDDENDKLDDHYFVKQDEESGLVVNRDTLTEPAKEMSCGETITRQRQREIMNVLIEEDTGSSTSTIATQLWPAAEYLATFLLEQISTMMPSTSSAVEVGQQQQQPPQKVLDADLLAILQALKPPPPPNTSLSSENTSCRDNHCVPILELGAGIGLTGLVLASKLPTQVMLTDLEVALPLLMQNVALNRDRFCCGPDAVQVDKLDWTLYEEDVPRVLQRCYPDQTLSQLAQNAITEEQSSQSQQLINLSTVTLPELETLLVECWGYPKYRVQQVWNWIRVQGVTDVTAMTNLPVALRTQLQQYSCLAALVLLQEWVSQHDGTIKRAYQCADGQVIESVLMPYEDGRYTACISSQAGCAQGCVFCAMGQMGLARQLTVEEIVEQVSRFATELQQQQNNHNHAANVGDNKSNNNDITKQNSSSSKNKKYSPQQQQQSPRTKDNNAKLHGCTKRLSNVVFMGMGEPLANYCNVMGAIDRITHDLGF